MRFFKKSTATRESGQDGESAPQKDPKARVVVAEINGELMAFVVNPKGPVVRIPIGELDKQKQVPVGGLKHSPG